MPSALAGCEKCEVLIDHCQIEDQSGFFLAIIVYTVNGSIRTHRWCFLPFLADQPREMDSVVRNYFQRIREEEIPNVGIDLTTARKPIPISVVAENDSPDLDLIAREVEKQLQTF